MSQCIPDRMPVETFPYDKQMALEPHGDMKGKVSKRMRFKRVYNLLHTLAASVLAAGTPLMSGPLTCVRRLIVQKVDGAQPRLPAKEARTSTMSNAWGLWNSWW